MHVEVLIWSQKVLLGYLFSRESLISKSKNWFNLALLLQFVFSIRQQSFLGGSYCALHRLNRTKPSSFGKCFIYNIGVCF